MWDNLCLFLFAGDVAQWDTSDRVVKSRALEITYSQGYVAAFDEAMIWFKVI